MIKTEGKYLDIAIQYAEDVINKKIPACKYIIRACQNFIELFNRSDIYYNEIEVAKVITFINQLELTNTKTKQNFFLNDWQIWTVVQIYGFYYFETDNRKISSVYIEVPKKNGKSFFVLALSMYHLIFDKDSQVVVAANSVKQTKDIDYKIIKLFSDQLDPTHNHLRSYYNSIKYGFNELFVVCAEGKKLDGFSPTCVVLDEVHASKNSEVFDNLKSGMMARDNGLMLVITTAGMNVDSFCYQLRSNYIEILEGKKIDDSQLTLIYTLDPEDNYQDKSIWKKANPNLGYSFSETRLSIEINKAINNTLEETGIKIKHFNLWLLNKNEENKYIDIEYVIKSFDKTISIDDKMFLNKPCYVGIDLASNSDLATITYQFFIDNKYYYFNRAFLPENNLNSGVNRLWYKKLAQEKYITLTSGNVTDYDYILNDLIKTREKHQIKLISYDPFNSSQFIIQAEENQFNCKQFSQGKMNINKPAKELARLLMSDKVVIEYNPLTQWCFNNCIVVYGANENIGLDKTNKNSKIDIVASTVNALGCYMEAPKYNNQIF